MACVYKRRKQYWISYYVNGQQIRQSLHTTNERVALAKKKRIDYELSLGDLQMASQLPLVPVLEAFCKYLESTRTFKSFKNDFSRLRTFFGPICQSLESYPPGVKRGQQARKAAKDKYAGAHVQVEHVVRFEPSLEGAGFHPRGTVGHTIPSNPGQQRLVQPGGFGCAGEEAQIWSQGMELLHRPGEAEPMQEAGHGRMGRSSGRQLWWSASIAGLSGARESLTLRSCLPASATES